MADQPLLLKRLRDDNELVRGLAAQGLWRLWSRSGDAAVDRLMAAGIERMQEARFGDAIAIFGEVIRRRPAFAEGWNKRATVRYLAGDLQGSLADCHEVISATRTISAPCRATARSTSTSGSTTRRSSTGAARCR